MKYERKDTFTKPETARDVLKIALEKEKSSYEFYSDILKKSPDAILAKLLEELKSAEAIHIQKVKAMLERY